MDNKLVFKLISILIIAFYCTLDRGCTSKQGWQPRGNYLDSGINQADDVYMTLRLPVKGFGSPEGLKKPKAGQYGLVEFVFELICDGECSFKFKEVQCNKLLTEWNYENNPPQSKFVHFLNCYFCEV